MQIYEALDGSVDREVVVVIERKSFRIGQSVKIFKVLDNESLLFAVVFEKRRFQNGFGHPDYGLGTVVARTEFIGVAYAVAENEVYTVGISNSVGVGAFFESVQNIEQSTRRKSYVLAV